ncbi:P-loop containing nucleoside triphosphate hydrolase protein [Microdochium trichocladiopsis]|uniref:P-loop containing nucleoside triphosphate hydrolase protein n=1 Tax=Microdochium trichocladiopsis TaxID=1682393 RepID=A0A9P8YEA7_9PEZI|nr:P-loop containing nucleoside triphosphate hydrolase protein [Microdochium trichocladiopsis]KAH7035448.1 P-loop containing nucleoside triphosphate hydrolase protein [Microdochium trichocladiopsis]
MDDTKRTNQDVASFDLSSTHRMPTVSAAQVLDDLGEQRSRFVSTGLDDLDEALTPLLSVSGQDQATAPRGLETSQVVEIWGPPGSGKTAFALQLAASSIRSGHQVVWVDGFHPISGQRFHNVLQGHIDQAEDHAETSPVSLDSLDALHHFTTPSLAHLLALLCKPTSSAIPDGTSLLVIDSFSALFNHAYPRNVETKKTPRGPSASSRRLQAIQFIISSLQKLAAAKEILVVIISQCATRMQADRSAIIAPAVSSAALEAGLGTRLVVFKDWIGHQESSRSASLVGIQKVNGTAVPEVIGQVFAFQITTSGIRNVRDSPSQDFHDVAYHKRKLDDTGFEIADSDDDVYGWISDDDTRIPGMSTQAQGSEDLLLGENDDYDSVSPHSGDESELSSPPETEDEL